MDQPTPPVMPTPEPIDAAEKVRGPAIGLMVATGIGMALAVLGLILNVLGVSFVAAAPEGDDAAMTMMSGGFAIVQSLIGLAIGAFVLFGAMKMMRLESWGLALAAAIVAMVPILSPCCVLGLPFGIWAIVVLTKPEVKAAFR